MQCKKTQASSIYAQIGAAVKEAAGQVLSFQLESGEALIAHRAYRY
jgi:hypothetical protein